MAIMVQSTEGFIDALASYIEDNMTTLGLTKGTNLFEETIYDDAKVSVDHIGILDAGHTDTPDQFILRLFWRVRFATARETRPQAIDALRPLNQEFLGKRTFRITNGTNSFRIINVRGVTSPRWIAVLESGKQLAEVVVGFEVIPLPA